jgi:flavin reductase (DIM6/NTAB) family NADH-FMN oxidoreductase RutF
MPKRHQIMLSCIAPRPIALAATMGPDGVLNLAPFSFFNAFSAEPAILALSPAYSGKDGSPKHTHLNAKETGELTVSIVSYAMAHQVNVTSCEYPAGISEFEKAGFTPHPSQIVGVPGVAEAPAFLECVVREILELGQKPGSGNLIIAEVVFAHVKENLWDSQGRIDPRLMDYVSRLGGNWWGRAREGLFELPKPDGLWIGFEALPRWVRESPLTGEQLCRLIELPARPQPALAAKPEWTAAASQGSPAVYAYLAQAIEDKRLDDAWGMMDSYKG